ncbi:MAG: tripartite tricarboxylate transporter substrate binding protein [Proteobacteria bacterium]|nr:tripartite tricarboxylate transporter substrate binding protein [Burkholderiales bacterium]
MHRRSCVSAASAAASFTAARTYAHPHRSRRALARAISKALVLVVATAVVVPAAAQSWPSKPIRLIVPFAAGGNVDITARLVGPAMQETLGQPVIVENRLGAGGMIASEMVAKSPADGYTLQMGSNSTFSVAPALYPNAPYHPIRDFTPISNIQVTPFVLIVRTGLPVQSVADLVKLARDKPGVLTMGSGGTGSSNQLVGELFQMLAGVKFLHVPYKGSALATTDVMGNQIDMLFDQGTTAGNNARNGKVRALAVSARARMALIPDVPTFGEAGVKEFDIANATGLLGPAALPPAVVQRLHAAVLKALATPQVKERFAQMGVDAIGSTPEEFAAFIKDDFARWTRVVQATGIKAD